MKVLAMHLNGAEHAVLEEEEISEDLLIDVDASEYDLIKAVVKDGQVVGYARALVTDEDDHVSLAKWEEV